MGCPIFRHPCYLRKGKSYGLQIVYAYSQGRLEQHKQKAMKNFGKSGHGRSQRVPKNRKFFEALRGHLCDSTAFLSSHNACCNVSHTGGDSHFSRGSNCCSTAEVGMQSIQNAAPDHESNDVRYFINIDPVTAVQKYILHDILKDFVAANDTRRAILTGTKHWLICMCFLAI